MFVIVPSQFLGLSMFLFIPVRIPLSRNLALELDIFCKYEQLTRGSVGQG